MTKMDFQGYWFKQKKHKAYGFITTNKINEWKNYLTSSSSISGTLYFGGYELVTFVIYALKGVVS